MIRKKNFGWNETLIFDFDLRKGTCNFRIFSFTELIIILHVLCMKCV